MYKRNEQFKDLVFYEIYPTSFYDSNNDGIGDLKGIKQKLKYVKELGCNAVWINPFYTSPFKDGGYDITNFFDVDPKFGTLKDFENLIKEAKKLKIKVIIDCIPGHMSEESKEFIKSGQEKRNEYTDFFIWNNDNWQMEPGYKLISGRMPRAANYMVNFFSTQPALNYGFKKIEYPKWQISYKDPRTFKVRDYIVKILKFWLKKGADGFRVDMADSLVKNDDDKSATIEVWQYIFKRVKNEYPKAFFVSEWSNPSQSFKAGFDCDFVLNHLDNFYSRFVRLTDRPSVLNGGDPSFFIKSLKWHYDEAYKHHGYLGIISGNHDTPRAANFLTPDRLKLFYMFVLMMPGIPFIYYGDEIMMKDSKIPNKDGGYFRVGARTPMQWDHSKNAGFSKANPSKLYLPVNKASKVNVVDSLKNKNSLYYVIKTLIKIRRKYPDILKEEMSFEVKDKVITLYRGKIKVILNASKNKTINLKNKIIFTTGKNKILKPGEGAIII